MIVEGPLIQHLQQCQRCAVRIDLFNCFEDGEIPNSTILLATETEMGAKNETTEHSQTTSVG